MNCQKCYVTLLVKYPYVIIAVIFLLSSTCLILPFTIEKMNLPNFQDPQLGFSTRNTLISDRLTTWSNLQNELRPSGKLIKNPKEFLRIRDLTNGTGTVAPNEPYLKRRGGRRKHHPNKKHRDKSNNENYIEDDHKNQTIFGKVITNEKNVSESPEITNKWQYLQNLTDHNPNIKPINYEKHFCGAPDEKYAHLVVTSIKGENLFTFKNIQSLCRLETLLMSAKTVPELCISNTQMDDRCCKPWTLVNYISVLFDRVSCIQIKESDVNKTIEILRQCAGYFHRNELYVNCFKNKECKVPLQCLKHDAVYNILNYLTSVTYLPVNNSNESGEKLEETILFLPIAASIASVPFYHEIEKWGLQFEDLTIAAMDFGIKSTIFDEYLLRDAWFMTLGACFIFICVWMYTSSLFLTFMTIIAIIFAMAITYFLYEVVYNISFFPFMNMLTVVICVGIGADNTFIFCKIWHLKKNDQSNDNDIEKIMSGTFDHAFKSMLVTSTTTAVAFWGSCVSSVTAISCFSIFAGTAIIVNFLLTITWLPACMVVWEQTWLSKSIYPCYFVALSQVFCCFKSRWSLSPVCCKCLTSMWNGKKEFLIQMVIKWRYFWIALFTSVAIVSTFIVFVKPGLRLPSTIDFQLFQSSHPFERYDFDYRNKFWFRKEKEGYSIEDYKMPLKFVWGVKAVDNGNHLNPADLGKVELDPSFDMSDPASQVFLKKFCADIKQQSFFEPILGVSLTSCFLETFVTSMDRSCTDEFSKQDRSPCCNTSKFPFNRTVFDECILDEMAEIYNGPSKFVYPKSAGALFSKEDVPTIRAVVVEFESSVTFSMSYEKVEEFNSRVSTWADKQFATAPSNMRNGFFVSDLGFYDLQRELSRGTKIAIFVSMFLATAILIFSTLNPVLSALAVVTITFSIITTIASLVLCGWSLNILESVAISTAIGLAVDFSLHYCINYRLCPPDLSRTPEDATRYALSCLMGPSFMAGLTTAAAGFFMIFSLILPYFQIGLFLVLIMTVSWLYATFFLGSLLVTMGPIKNCCQYSYAKLCRGLIGDKNDRNETHDRNEPITGSSSATDLDRISFIKQDTPRPLKKKMNSFKEPYVRYTPSHGLADQSPSSNVTIIMADGVNEEN